MLQVHPAVIAFGFANDQFRYGKSMPPSRISLRRRRSSMRSMRRTNVQWRIRRPSHCHLQGLLTLFQMWWVCPKMVDTPFHHFEISSFRIGKKWVIPHVWTKPDLDVQLNLMGVDQKNKTPRKQHVNPKAHIKINGNFRIPLKMELLTVPYVAVASQPERALDPTSKIPSAVVVGWALPLWKIMEWVKVSWDHEMPYILYYIILYYIIYIWKVMKFMFQTSYDICLNKYGTLRAILIFTSPRWAVGY